jgi:hypothetical protein
MEKQEFDNQVSGLLKEQFGTGTGKKMFFILTRDCAMFEGYNPETGGYVIMRFIGNSVDDAKACFKNCHGRFDNLGTFTSEKAARDYMSKYPAIPIRLI